MPSNLGFNPWTSIWTHPRKTIRAIIEKNPKYHFIYLATIYALQTVLFYASYLSLGLSYHYALIIVVSLVLSPFIGVITLYFHSWILYFTGRWLKGQAPFLHIRAALSWSKVPLIINVIMWFTLLVFSSKYIFAEHANGTSMIFVNLIVLIGNIWSLVILVQNVREVQNFTLLRSIGNLILFYLVFYALVFAFIWIYSNLYYLITSR